MGMLPSPKVYLAGPDVFEPNAVERGEQLKALCTKHGLTGLFPLDNTIETAEPGSIAHAAAIRTANMMLISSCDAILANLTPFRGPSMDVGTAYEMGAGSALGKVVVGYTTDGGGLVDNLMISCGMEKLCNSEDEGLAFIAELLKG